MIRISVPEGESGNPHGYAARHYAPTIMAAAERFAMAVYCDSALSLREFEGARVRMAQINGCTICQVFRAARDAPAMVSATGARPAKMVIDNGPAPDEAFYDAVPDWRASTVFSDRERLAIEYAERFAEEPKVLAIDEAFWARAHKAFTDAEIIDLAHCVAAWMGLGRIAHVLGFDSGCKVDLVAA